MAVSKELLSAERQELSAEIRRGLVGAEKRRGEISYDPLLVAGDIS